MNMTIEQKAKAYDEAIEKLRNAFYDNNSRMCEEYRNAALKIIEPIFPELAESEDERIRKDLIAYLRGILYNEKYGDKFIESWIAWLEKQGKTSPVLSNSSNIGKDEQKPAWKPSDEQMEYLAKAITTLGDEGNCKTASILNDLRVELKKLREK